MADNISNRSILTIILAGGMGERLYPLTKDRAKPAVPFGGRYRIIDFVINNFINSGFFKLKVLTQFKSNSLIEHLTRTWRLPSDIGQYVDCVPAQMRRGPFWFRGTADAVYQNLDLVFDERPEHVCVFGGDHIYKMDISQILSFHLDKDADLTIATIPVPVAEAPEFGVLEIDSENRVIGFEEKPKENPKTIPGKPHLVLASMGNYIFRASTIIETLEHDALNDTSHDFGKTIIPSMLANHTVYAYDFSTNVVPGEFAAQRGYWRDVGTIDAYYSASMDLIAVTPVFNLYNPKWPLKSLPESNPPAKFIFSDQDRMGVATNSMVSHGCIISGGSIDLSILFPRVKINSFSRVEESILMAGVEVGRYSSIRRAIIDKGVRIPQHTEIGYDLEADRRRFTVTDSGIVVIPKGTILETPGKEQGEISWGSDAG